MAFFQNFVRNLGAQNAPFGFDAMPMSGSPNQYDPAFNSGMRMIGNVGLGMLANSDKNPLEAFGRSYLGAQDQAQDQNKNQYIAAQMMQAADEKKQERAREQERQQMIEAQISQLPENLRGLARIAPEKVFGNMIDSQFGSPDMTDDMKEYNWAVKNGYQGSPIEYLTTMKRPPASYGTIPPGFQLVQEGNSTSMQPIPGSPAALEAEQASSASQRKAETKSANGDMMVEDIDRTLSTVKSSTLPTTGLVGNILKNVGGTGAGDVNKLLTGIKANIGFDSLQRMREESPTGGALGQVAVQELESLQSVYGSLEQSQSKDQFEYNLKRLKNMYLDIVHGPDSGPPREKLDTGYSQENTTSSGVKWRAK